MSIQEQWLVRFRAVVKAEIDAAHGKESDGYRAVEAKTGLGYDYIYQVYKGKSKGLPGLEAMEKIEAAYPILPARAPEPEDDPVEVVKNMYLAIPPEHREKSLLAVTRLLSTFLPQSTVPERDQDAPTFK